MKEKEIVTIITDRLEEAQCKPLFIASPHNFKITLDLFHAMASTFKSDKQIAVLYYLLKNIGSDSVLTIRMKFVQGKLGLTNATFYGLMRRMRDNNIIKYIELVNPPKGYQGHQKMMVNPTMIYNHKKTKSNTEYQDNVKYWEYL